MLAGIVMHKNRVIFLRSNPVNPDSRVEKEADCLLKAGYQVKILSWDRGIKSKKFVETELSLLNGYVDIIRFGIPASYGDGVKNIWAFIQFQLFIIIWLIKNKKNYDIVHACDFDTAFSAFICKIFTKKILVFDIFDFLYTNIEGSFKWFKKLIVLLQYLIINKSDGTILCSEERIEQINGAIPKKMAIIHNSPPFIENLAKLDLNSDKVKISYVGILQDYRFLMELSQVVIKDKRLELHIGGFGKYESYFTECSKNNSNIKYYGKLPYINTLELENSCDIMVAIYDPKVGNHYFAAPNKFYEALMLGKPIIMAKGTGMAKIVENNNLGEVIDYNICSLENGINNLLENKNNWDKVSTNMKNMYLEKYSWIKMQSRLLHFYASISNRDD